jgi:hypothetical protein
MGLETHEKWSSTFFPSAFTRAEARLTGNTGHHS